MARDGAERFKKKHKNLCTHLSKQDAIRQAVLWSNVSIADGALSEHAIRGWIIVLAPGRLLYRDPGAARLASGTAPPRWFFCGQHAPTWHLEQFYALPANPSLTRKAGSWLDGLDLSAEFRNSVPTLQTVPRFLVTGVRQTLVAALGAIRAAHEGRDDVARVRAWKLFLPIGGKVEADLRRLRFAG